MKKFIYIFLSVICLYITIPVVSAASDSDIKTFINNFTEYLNAGDLSTLNLVDSSNIKLSNNITTYMDSFKITDQEITKIKEKNNKYEVTAKATIESSGSKNKTKLKYEVKEDAINGLSIATTNIFDKIGHGSLISNTKTIVVFVVLLIIGGAVFIYLKRKNDLKELNHMRKNENSTGLGGMMDHR